MKYQDRYEKKYSNKKSNIGANHVVQKSRKRFKWSDRWQIVYDKRYKKYRLISTKISPSEFVIYSVLNSGVNMELGVAAIMITYSILDLCDKLAVDQVKNIYIDQWKKSGKNILIVQGCNHKHLKYIEGEAKFVSLGTHAIHHSGVMLVLSVFGRKEEIEDIFDGLPFAFNALNAVISQIQAGHDINMLLYYEARTVPLRSLSSHSSTSTADTRYHPGEMGTNHQRELSAPIAMNMRVTLCAEAHEESCRSRSVDITTAAGKE